MLDFVKNNLPVNKSFDGINKGDVVETSLGKLYAFDRFPKGGKNWYGKSMTDGKSYRIRIIGSLYSENFKVVGSYNFQEKPAAATKDMQNDVNTLSVGDLFVIKHGRGNNAELFRFVRSTAKKVVSINPVTNKTYNIDKGFVFTKIANLPY